MGRDAALASTDVDADVVHCHTWYTHLGGIRQGHVHAHLQMGGVVQADHHARHAAVERKRIAQRRHGAFPRPDQRQEGASRWTDESVLCLWADEVRLRIAAGICALEREERSGGRERSTQGKRVAAIENALTSAIRPPVKRARCACRFPPHDRVAG